MVINLAVKKVINGHKFDHVSRVYTLIEAVTLDWHTFSDLDHLSADDNVVLATKTNGMRTKMKAHQQLQLLFLDKKQKRIYCGR